MANKTKIHLKNKGVYKGWKSKQKDIPELLKYTDTVPAEIGIEFGYVLHIEKGKGKKINFMIEHPPFLGNDGRIAPPFEGEYYITSNDFLFFLGDCIWAPIEDKIGNWRLLTYIDNVCVADELINVEPS